MPSKINDTYNYSGAVERPTLPSIHTLALPMPGPLKRDNVPYSSKDNITHARNQTHGRNVSTSSSVTNASRSSVSPPPQDLSVARRGSPSSSQMPAGPTKFRLVSCPMQQADALIYVPAPGTYVRTPTNYAARTGTGQGILLVGRDVQQLRRCPSRALAKGARVHPYRILKGAENCAPPQRRMSVVSYLTTTDATLGNLPGHVREH